MVEIRRASIVLVDLNPVIGTEQAGIRPAVIIQTDKANKVSPHTIIAPFTSKIRSAILPSHVFIQAGKSGLKMDFVILCEQLRVVDKKRILKFIGQLSEELTIKLNNALIAILDIKQPTTDKKN